MPRTLICTLILTFATHWLLAEQEPSQDVFNDSLHEVSFHVPADFQLVKEDRRYLNPAAHESPRLQRIWQHGSDGIILTVVILPEAAWQHGTHKQRFDVGVAGMLSDPTLKLVSRRSYELDGYPAESMTCFFQNGGTSQRMDGFLVKPNLFMIAYVSSKPSSWDDPASKAFFQSISLKPKK
jgi:hypothetical protein